MFSAPRSAIVIGAGMVGLATALELCRRGVAVTVLDREGVAAGSSLGNAGWISPGLAMPLADPAIWPNAIRSLLDPDAPLHIPPRIDPRLWSFLARFASHATHRRWDHTMAALTTLDTLALDAFDRLVAAGVAEPTHTTPYTVAFERGRDARGFVDELARVARAGQDVTLERVHTAPAQLSGAVSAVYTLSGQRFLAPGPFVADLARVLREHGGTILTGERVDRIDPQRGQGRREVRVRTRSGSVHTADAVVIATGAWLPDLARRFGVRTRVQAGRGYSFSVPTAEPVQGPIYFPTQRVACTPFRGGLRVAGTMEFRGPDEPLQQRRIQAIVRSVRPLFRGVDLDDRSNEWVGSRPVTPDGLALIGRTRAPGVYVAGGHGMWGMVLGPITAELLTEQIMTGIAPEILTPFDPLR
ncbi:FAD-dependent oxidoreductase [Mycetocola lacteus]|uniref:FAD-dependent oxidoreductase n=1 Tax=Mycetocola lacteus TaxID=76637 RepID=A0A3L7AX43_9MICO|nr:FAD-dependent oxidoreductase [Mycetocola lacteus]RLP80670.1 FAD-dependent oxidoreductase [Mycetocola lacteus]RLP84455.1 FAD-dependent oxidoreductase [Mycetocola lacteus]